jgi:hypothetical protein
MVLLRSSKALQNTEKTRRKTNERNKILHGNIKGKWKNDNEPERRGPHCGDPKA